MYIKVSNKLVKTKKVETRIRITIVQLLNRKEISTFFFHLINLKIKDYFIAFDWIDRESSVFKRD